MSNDASAAAASPMTNGIAPAASHREADASTALRQARHHPASPTEKAFRKTLAEVCADLHQRVTEFLNAVPQDDLMKRTQEQTRTSLGVIRKALEDYDFDTLSLSYNGGKDCLVLLIIYLAAIHIHCTSPTSHQQNKPFPTSIPSIYAKPPDPFPQVGTFVDSSSTEYHLDLTHISTNPGTYPNPAKAKSHSSPPAHTETEHTQQHAEQQPLPDTTNNTTPHAASDPSTASVTLPPNLAQAQQRIITFRDAFALYLQTNPRVLAIFVGTRRTDPHGRHLTHFDMTDGKWPRFMRIHPVIDWQLGEIWTFLRSPHLADKTRGQDVLEYCQMYDKGYTSLGGVNDTLRNPRLRVVDPETGRETWKPAYCLVEDGEERLGRE